MNYMKNGNWVRYQNGNYFVSINLDNGTKIRETINPDATEFVADFPESADVKITNRCTNPLGYTNLTDKEIKCGKGNCNFCHEGSGPCGKHSDALHSHVWDTFHPYTELALGGGNVLEYPDLIPLLERLKSLHLIPNITVHQTHFMENLPLLHKLVDKKLIYGLGISMNDVNKEGFIEAVKEFPNAVIHVINGIVTKRDFDKLSNNGLKILILGYKEIRKGKSFKRKISKQLNENIQWLREYLRDYVNCFETISFDNLCLKQLFINENTINLFTINDKEIWKDIEGYENLYQISNFGRIKSLSGFFHDEYVEREKILNSTTISNAGYQSVQLQKNGEGKRFLVHRLVAQAFIPNPHNLPQINHKDENVHNNYFANLEWCDNNYNLNYGTHNKNMSKTLSKRINQYSLDGQLIKSWDTINDASTELKCSKAFIRELCTTGTARKCYRHKFDNLYNYIWRYSDNESTQHLKQFTWETIYMGDDGLDGEQTSASMYIDLVENEFARNSCDVDHRMPVGNMSVKEMYKILCKM